MNEKTKWLKLTQGEIRKLLKKMGIIVSRKIIRKLLKKHGFVKRKMQKTKSTGAYQERDKQFKQIEKLKKAFINSDNPMISIDTKKKEKVGNLYRDGQVYCTQAIEAYDHDYAYLAKEIILPHGIYDIKRNEALMYLGAGKETAEFICDAIKKWWDKVGKRHYVNATEILIFCDAGGANSYRHHVFKVALQNLANLIKLSLRICHYPPYASKWNPIEHRVFPHVSHAMEGVKLESIDDDVNLIKKTKTSTGLKVWVAKTKKVYKSGARVAKDAIDKVNLIMHGKLGSLNYTVVPSML